jgi:hypothetical protein
MITSNMSEEEERQFIVDCLGSLEDTLG